MHNGGDTADFADDAAPTTESHALSGDSALVDDTIEIPVQVNGKVRARITVPADADRDALEAAARAEPNVAAHLEGATVRKVIVVPAKMVNFVVA